jgi:bifunctional ADP-heptose synthase (sugar kinase/adenylyltransferase)
MFSISAFNTWSKLMSVIVIGDPMIDVWARLKTSPRKNPEANAPIWLPLDTEVCPGGALNVVASIHGGLFAPTQGLTEKAIRTLEQYASLTHVPTPRANGLDLIYKTRLIVDGEQRARLDADVAYESERLSPFLRAELKSAHAVVLVDYNKGTITSQLVYDIIAATSAPVFIDAKPKLHRALLLNQGRLRNAIVRANSAEATELGFSSASEWRWAADVRAAIITHGAEGAEYSADASHEYVRASTPSHVTSIVGAGDVFTAVFINTFLSNNQHVGRAVEAAVRVATQAVASSCTTLRA